MKRHLIRTLSLTAVLALMISVMSAAFALVGAKEIGGSSIFDASNADNTTEYTDGQTSYLSYRLEGDSNSVRFRRNLALKWYSSAEADAESLRGAAQYFNLTIGFDNLNFDSFSIALETSQFSMSKEGKTTNTLTFTKNSDSGLDVSVNGAESSVTVASTSVGVVEIAFSGDDTNGNFTVTVNGAEAGTFTNIGRYYAQYASASATNPLTPLTFSAAGVTGDGADFNIQSMNGQDFDIINADGDIDDTTPPVLVVNSDIRQIYFGMDIDFDTVAIDVCSSSGITTDEYYYYPGLEAEDDPDVDDDTLTYGGRTYAALDSDTTFYPDDFDGDGQVSLAYRVSDGETSKVYLIEWSAEDVLNPDGAAEFYIPIKNADDVEETPTTTFITYTKNSSGNILLNAPSPEDDDYDEWYEQNIKPYQDKVTAASYVDGDEANGSIQVGEGAYYYIPAFKEYIADSTCGYTDMEFTVYYRTSTSDSVSSVSGSYDELRIELTSEGRYQFRIVPTNKAGNVMVGVFASGPDTSPRYTEGEITTDNVFDAKNLVTFEFTVQYTGPSVETPEDDDETGYVDVTYTVEDFEIIGISGYTTQYRLYYFNAKDSSQTYTAAQLREADANGTIDSLGEWRLINEYDSDLDEDDGDNIYDWNPDSSLSFVPQERGFYKVEVLVAADNMKVVSEAKYIQVSAEATVIPGETYWLENNVLSLVFLGIGVLCLIGIVVILLIKPKNKVAAEADSARKAELKEKREKRK